MAIVLSEHGLAYLPAPKCASSSLKRFFFHIENGRPFRPFTANGRRMNMHNAVYRTREFADLPHARMRDLDRFAVVRDPVKRFLSAYAHRILRRDGLRDLQGDLPARPDLDTFIDRIDEYRAASRDIARHTAPQSLYLGRDPGYYARLFALSEIDELAALVCARTGRDAALPSIHSAGPKLDIADITAGQRRRIERMFEADYALCAPVAA